MDICDGSLDSDISPFSSCICECDECYRVVSEIDICIDLDISTEDDDGAFCFFSRFSVEFSNCDNMICSSIDDKIVYIIVDRPIAREEGCLLADRVDEIDSSTCSTTDSLSGLSEDLDSLTRRTGGIHVARKSRIEDFSCPIFVVDIVLYGCRLSTRTP